jgi:hypothetical protein
MVQLDLEDRKGSRPFRQKQVKWSLLTAAVWGFTANGQTEANSFGLISPGSRVPLDALRD